MDIINNKRKDNMEENLKYNPQGIAPSLEELAIERLSQEDK